MGVVLSAAVGEASAQALQGGPGLPPLSREYFVEMRSSDSPQSLDFIQSLVQQAMQPQAYGEPAQQGQHPWQVAIVRLAEFNSAQIPASKKNSLICGGVWLGGQWIVTAAHCLSQFGADIRSDESIRDSLRYVGVAAGSIELSRITSAVGVSDFQTPRSMGRDYKWIAGSANRPVYRNDLVLLKVRESLRESGAKPAVVAPSDLALQLVRDGAVSTAAGWGFSEEGFFSDILRAPLLTVVPQHRCGPDAWRQYVFEEMFCVGDVDRDTFRDTNRYPSACVGDSGGAVTLQHEGVIYVVGVLSWGATECGVAAEYPNVATRLSTFEKIVSDKSIIQVDPLANNDR